MAASLARKLLGSRFFFVSQNRLRSRRGHPRRCAGNASWLIRYAQPRQHLVV